MRLLRQAGAVLALLLVASSIAVAQARPAARGASGARPIELGMDAILELGLDDPSSTILRAPVGIVRIGFHRSDVLSIEPFGAVSYAKFEGSDGSTGWLFGLGGLYHFSTDRSRSQFYVRPFLSLDGQTDSDSEFTIGVGGGMKFRPRMNGRFQLRGEVGLANRADRNSLNVMFGASVYPR